MIVNICVPDLGFPPEEPIRLSLWYAEEGDQLRQGDHLAELLVSGAVVDLDAPADGILIERTVGLHEHLRVGQVIARLEANLRSVFDDHEVGDVPSLPE
ncbi:MAG: lipoyl domain-containing protein [Gemmatales bacterium]|nr:lipoyl domain-containing protein [Gemmatales bacterium]MCS7160123.1 lipoyl domain-containing protein [Gemmatales bacterium]MDW8175323.1 lipoyl domain-containing protein [Gemmatales bacterium]MDW8221643.1 lipoyl domain-containing protein [Gemmatales bacterium]